MCEGGWRNCYFVFNSLMACGKKLFCYEGYGASSQSPAAGVGGVSPDVMSPGQAAFFFNVLDARK